MNALTPRTTRAPATRDGDHALDIKTKKDMLYLVYQTLLTQLGQTGKLSIFKAAISHMPEHEIDMEWEAIQNGTASKALQAMMSGNLDAEDMQQLGQLFEGIAVPYFDQYHGNVPKEDMKWAHNEIKDFFDKVHNKAGNQLPGAPTRRRLGGAFLTAVAKKLPPR